MTGDIFMLLLYSAYDIPLVSLQYPNYNDNCKKKTENMVMFFLCTVERHSIIKPVFLHTFKSYNKEISKPDESLGRKATGPLKWQPVA